MEFLGMSVRPGFGFYKTNLTAHFTGHKNVTLLSFLSTKWNVSNPKHTVNEKISMIRDQNKRDTCSSKNPRNFIYFHLSTFDANL